MVKILRENNELKQIPLNCIKGATLLPADEAENLLTREERMCKGTQEAISNGLYVTSNRNSYYWLRSPGRYSYCACLVDGDGAVNYYYNVDRTYFGVRPALIISNLQSSNLRVGDCFKFGSYAFKIISNNLALCDVIIDACPFNQNRKDGNDYEASYIKDKVDNWFYNVYKDMECKEYSIPTDDELFDVKGMTGW